MLKFLSKFPASPARFAGESARRAGRQIPDSKFQIPDSRSQKGFTLVEILIAVGILLVLTGLGLFLSMDIYRGSSLDSERDKVISILQKARTRALSNINQSPHGVRFEDDKYVIFEGTAYDSTDPKNEEFPAPENISHSPSMIDIVFNQLTGNSSYTSTLVLSGQGKTATISFNAEGRIDW